MICLSHKRLFMTLLSHSLLHFCVFFQEGKENRDWGASWSNTPPLCQVSFCHSCLHKMCPRGWRTLKLSFVFLMASCIDHCMVTCYSSWRRAVVRALFFSWLILFCRTRGVAWCSQILSIPPFVLEPEIFSYFSKGISAFIPEGSNPV